MSINIIVVFGVLIAAATIGAVATSPDIAVVPLVLSLSVVAVVLPIVLYPISYTTWHAVDLAMHPPDGTDPETPPWRP